jgi:ribosomal protein S27E
MNKNVTCHTDGCENKDITILFEGPAEIIFCGPCGIQIEDVIPVG